MNKFQASNFLSVTLVGSSSAGFACLWLLDASVKSLLLLSLGAVACFLLSRASAATRHWIWATLLIGLIRRVASIAHELNVKQPRIIVGTDGAMPMVWSFASGRLLLPKDCDQWTMTRLNAVLSHELIHLRRRDPLLFLLGLAARAMNWFNPLAWYAVRRLRIECERACDDHVLRLGIDASEYAGHLLAFSTASQPAQGTSSLAFAMSAKPNIEQRIISVLDEKLNRRGVTFRRAFMLLLVVASGVALLATLRATVASESLIQADDEKVAIKYPYCVVKVDNLQPRPLAEAIKAFNLEAKQSPTGVGQRPISEPETLAAIAKSLEQPEVADSVKAVLRDIANTKMLPAKAYFRRFTRFDDEQQMHGVWWVRLCIEGETPPMYSVPIRTTEIFARPYSQLEREQNSGQGVSLINRRSSYFEEPPQTQPAEELPQAAIEKLLARVKKGLDDKSIDELKTLFDWKGAALREFAESELQMLMKATIHSIKVEPQRLEGNLLHWSGFQVYHPNLPVVAYLAIEYTHPEDAANRKSVWLELGISNDDLQLVNYVAKEPNLPAGLAGISMRGHTEQLADGIYQLTSLITNPGELISAHLANEEVRHRDYEHKRAKSSVAKIEPSIRPAPTRIGESRFRLAEGAYWNDFLELGTWQSPIEKVLIFQPRLRNWKVRLVEASTGNPVPGIKIRVQSLADGQHNVQPVKATSDADGLANVQVIEGAPARVEVVSTNWWQVAQTLLDEKLFDKTAENAGEKSQIIDVKLNRGQPIELPTQRTMFR